MLKFAKLFTLTLIILGSSAIAQTEKDLDCNYKKASYHYYLAFVNEQLNENRPGSKKVVRHNKDVCDPAATFTYHVIFMKSGEKIKPEGKLYVDGKYDSEIGGKLYDSIADVKSSIAGRISEILKARERKPVKAITSIQASDVKRVGSLELDNKIDIPKDLSVIGESAQESPDTYDYKIGAKLLGDRKLRKVAGDIDRKSSAINKKQNQINDIVTNDEDLKKMVDSSGNSIFVKEDDKYVLNEKAILTEENRAELPIGLQNKIDAVGRKKSRVTSKKDSYQDDFIKKSGKKIKEKQEVLGQLESDMSTSIESGNTTELGKEIIKYRQGLVEEKTLVCEQANMELRKLGKSDKTNPDCQKTAEDSVVEDANDEDTVLGKSSAAHAKMVAKDARDTSVDIDENEHIYEVAAKIVDEEKIKYEIDCTKKVKDGIADIAANNDTVSIFGSGKDYKLTSPAQCRDARDDGIFAENEDLYSAESLDQNFYKLLKAKGRNLFCHKMVKAKNKKLGYSCQNFLDARSRCESLREHKLITNEEVIKLLADINEKDEFDEDDEISGGYENSVFLLESGFTDIKPYTTDRYGDKQFTFYNSDVCNEVLLNEFLGCMGDQEQIKEGTQKLISNSLVHPGGSFGVERVDMEKLLSLKSEINLKELKTPVNIEVEEGKYEHIKNIKPELSEKVRVAYSCTGDSCPSAKTIKQRAGVAFYDQYGTCLTTRKVVFDNYNRDEVELVEGSFKRSEQKSFDGRFVCKQTREWTLDYGSCLGLINAYGAVALGTKGVDLFNRGSSQIRNTKKAQERSERVVPEGEDPLISGINAQRDTYSIKQQEETIRMTANAAAAAGLTTKMTMFYNSPKKNARRCENLDEGDERYMKYYCHIAHYWSASGAVRDGEFFPNQEVRAQMWSVVSQLTVESALAGMRAADAKNRKRKLDKYKAKFAALEDNSEARQNFIDLDYCKFNPASPQCRGRGANGPASNGFTNGGISMQSGGQNFNIKDNDDSFGEYDDNIVAGTKNSAVEDLGNLMDNESVSHLSNDFNAPGAGKVGKAGPGGGAGGGGGSLGGSGGGGGAGPSGAKSAGGKQKYKVTTKKGKYNRGGTVKFGKAGSVRKKKASRNAFSKLLGNGRSRKVASDDKTILPSHSGLFDKISKRYNRLSVDNRIHNLEKIKK